MSNFNYFDKGLHREYNYYSMGKWLYYPNRVNRIKERRYYNVMPVTAQIVPTLACNFSCPRCSYGGSKINIMALREKSRINMVRSTMFSIIDKLLEGRVKGVVFTGGGEPILNPFTIDGLRTEVFLPRKKLFLFSIQILLFFVSALMQDQVKFIVSYMGMTRRKVIFIRY